MAYTALIVLRYKGRSFLIKAEELVWELIEFSELSLSILIFSDLTKNRLLRLNNFVIKACLDVI